MKLDSPLFRLKHILERIEMIDLFMDCVSKKEFMENREKQEAVLRCFEIIGEAVNQLSKEFTKKHARVDWSNSVGLRIRAAHLYYSIDWNIVWDSYKNALPQFKQQIEKIIAEEENKT
ncbi:TPA: DUF86 domain-containing protein [Candidatus Micrarchaeota archaeon]|nr:MAG: hypothetical protein AUJ65_02370 [Candidatus Micrarchaeota archaeon CG1_02_51_15]HII39112.1 DUF86 domain-containing protein [Candidatus Micrarchaeota archaeon]